MIKNGLDFICYYAVPREKDYLLDLSIKQRHAKQDIFLQYLEPILIRDSVSAVFELSKGLEGKYKIAEYSPKKVADQVWEVAVDNDSLGMLWSIVVDSLEWPERRVIAFIASVPILGLDLFLAQWHAPGRLKNPRVPLGRMLSIITRRMGVGHCAIVFDRDSISQFMLIKPVSEPTGHA